MAPLLWYPESYNLKGNLEDISINGGVLQGELSKPGLRSRADFSAGRATAARKHLKKKLKALQNKGITIPLIKILLGVIKYF